METMARLISDPETRFASLKAALIDLEASSILVILPFLSPCALAIPAPVIFILLSVPISAITAQIFVDPMSMARILLLFTYIPSRKISVLYLLLSCLISPFSIIALFKRITLSV